MTAEKTTLATQPPSSKPGAEPLAAAGETTGRTKESSKRATKTSASTGSRSAKARSTPDPTQHPAVQKRLAEMPKSCRRNYLQAVQGKASPRNALKAFCLHCCGWDHEEVRHCTSPACEHYAYRPFKEEPSHGS